MPVQRGKVQNQKVNFGVKDLFFFIVYVMMALPIAQLMHAIFGGLVWPWYPLLHCSKEAALRCAPWAGASTSQEAKCTHVCGMLDIAAATYASLP